MPVLGGCGRDQECFSRIRFEVCRCDRLVISGRGAAWLARLLGVQEVPSSNLGGPTKFLKGLQRPHPSKAVFGVQLESRFGCRAGFLAPSLRSARDECGRSPKFTHVFLGALYSYKNPTNPTFGV
jgi:hypothetical protein